MHFRILPGGSMANSRSEGEGGVSGGEGTEGATVMAGIHGGEEAGGSFVAGAGLFHHPMHTEAVAQTVGHTHKNFSRGVQTFYLTGYYQFT